MVRRLIWFLVLAGILGGLAAPAAAQADYPTRTITLLCPWPPGGWVDATARIVASLVEKDLGQPVVVTNKVGAGGQLAWTELAKARPDGYTIGMVNFPNMSTIVFDPERKATFDVGSYTHLINQILNPVAVWVKPDSKYRNLRDLVEDAKARPGQVRVGLDAILGDDHLAMLLFEQETGAKLRNVHFEGAAPQIPALLGGQVDVVFQNASFPFVPRAKAGEVRAIGVFERERSPFLPEVQTSIEQGYKTTMSVTSGIAGPKGIPEPVTAKLQAAFRKAMENPEHRAKLEQTGVPGKILVGPEYGKMIDDLHRQAKTLVEQFRKTN